MRDLGWEGLPPTQRRRPIWEGVTPGGGGRPTQITIFAFSATRQTAMPIRIVPRFCARGYCRFEKLLYGCRNPSRWDRTDVVAKISMLRLNIGSGMLRLSSCMLSIGRGPKAVQGKGGGCPPLPCSHLGPRPMLSMHELSLPEPMLSLSMLILATYPVAALNGTIRNQNQN